MKKFFLVIILMFFMICPIAYSAENTSVWTSNTNTTRVNTIGKALLTKNNLPSQITFKVVDSEEVNAFANGDNEICVYTGLLQYVTDDAELAGVIAHEVGHILNSHVAKQSIINAITATAINNANWNTQVKTGAVIAQNLSMKKLSRTEETEADVTGVDLMTKAGYNPLAMVSVLYKISGNYVDILQDHPSGDKRTMYIYDYITYTYPDKAKLGYSSDSYSQFMAYATPIVNKRNSTPSLLNKFNKEQAKLKTQRLSKLKKYQNSENELGWKASYTLLKSLSGTN